jgi:chemotaxis signal transduction protein
MDKMTGEEDFKGLEEEIDDAVDRLFVENKRGGRKTLSTESPRLEPSLPPPTPELSIKSQILEPSPRPPDLEPLIQSPLVKSSVKSSLEEPSMEATMSQPSMKPPVLEPSMKTSLLEPSHEFESDKSLDLQHPPHPPSASVLLPKSVENMEAQLLSLEWEITQEKLEKTREEVLALREAMKQKVEMASLLSYMEEVLSHMIKNEENIRPSWIKFLLDCKETLKLLMRKETEVEINTYKQLAHLGIEARFACLEGLKKDAKIVVPSPGRGVGIERSESPIPREKSTVDMSTGEKKIEDVAIKMNLFMEKAEEIFRTMRQQAAKIEEMTRKAPAPSAEPKSEPVSVTILRVDKRLFGVEGEKIFKLFKVPTTFLEKYPGQQKIRLKDLEVKIVDLRKLFSISGGERLGETRILTVKENEEYKGLLVDEVLNKSSAPLEKKDELGEYCSGVIHSTYQERLVEIPVLDLKKL